MDAITESSKSSVDGIIAALTEAVHEHRLQPGTKLREDEVCALFGVSRTIVRQALRSMAQEGLLTIRKNKGAMVSQPSLKEAHEVFQARALWNPAQRAPRLSAQAPKTSRA